MHTVHHLDVVDASRLRNAAVVDAEVGHLRNRHVADLVGAEQPEIDRARARGTPRGKLVREHRIGSGRRHVFIYGSRKSDVLEFASF